MSEQVVIPEDANYKRARFIGGSDAAAVMGLGAYGRTPYTTWLQKTGQLPTDAIDPEKKKFFERRKRFEPLIVQMLREEFEVDIEFVNRRYVDTQHDFLAAEIDFEWVDPESGELCGGEIKTVSPFAFGERHGWGEPGTDEIPVHYAAQIVHGMGIRGYKKSVCAALVGFDTMLFYPVQRDDVLIRDMRDKCVRFWNEHVLTGIPPDPHTFEDLQHMLLNRRRGRAVPASAEILALIDKRMLASDAVKTAEEQVEEFNFQILDAVRKTLDLPEGIDLPDDKIVLTNEFGPIASYNKQRGSSLDQKRLKADKPDLVKEYTREYYFRALRKLKQK